MPLILNRYENERILIGDDIGIVVLTAMHGRAILSIDAPKDVCIDRAEIRTLRKLGLLGKDDKPSTALSHTRNPKPIIIQTTP